MALFIPIVNLSDGPPPVYFHYVGRQTDRYSGHPLANPFSVREFGRAGALERYREWIGCHHNRNALIAEIVADTECGRLPMACWCGSRLSPDMRPIECHAEVIAEWVGRLYPDLQSLAERPWGE